MIEWQDLRDYIGATDTDEARLTRSLDLAKVLVDEAFRNTWRYLPEVVVDECYLRAGSNVYKQSEVSEGGLYAQADGTPSGAVANDPLRKCWPLIRKYVLPL